MIAYICTSIRVVSPHEPFWREVDVTVEGTSLRVKQSYPSFPVQALVSGLSLHVHAAHVGQLWVPQQMWGKLEARASFPCSGNRACMYEIPFYGSIDLLEAAPPWV